MVENDYGGKVAVPLSHQLFEAGEHSAVSQIAKDSLDGLAHLHGLGLDHADVKPATALLLQDGKGRLAARIWGLGHVLRGGVPELWDH